MPKCPSQPVVVLIVAALAAGCAGDGPSGDGDDGWFDMIQRDVFDQSCVSGACHDSGNRAGNLSLAAGESYDQLVGIEPENSTAREAGLLRVEPDSVLQSFLVLKLTGDLAPGEDAQMPLSAAPLAPDQIANIEAWIAAGAPRTGPPPDSTGPMDPTGSSYDEIVGVEPENGSARQNGLLRVAASDPDASFLLAKMTGELEPGEGAQMPLAGTPLSPSTIDMFRAWIAAGAQRDTAG